MPQVMRESAVGMLTAGMSTRAVVREYSFLYHNSLPKVVLDNLAGSTFNRPHNRRPCVWHCVGERFADANVVNRVAVGLWYGQALATMNTIAFFRWQFECTDTMMGS